MSPIRLLPALALLSTLTTRPLQAQRGDAPTQLDTSRVTSRISAVSATPTRSTEVLSRADIDGRAARTLSDLLAFALGADVLPRSPAQADIGLRGSTFNQVTILVDGIRVSDVQSGHYALDLAVPLATIERIEILRGTGSALYGSDAVGGVINIVTRADTSSADIGVRAGSFGGIGGHAAVSRIARGIRLRGAVDVDRSDGHREGTDYRIVQARGAAERPFGSAHITAEGGLGIRHFGAADFYSPYPSFEVTRSTTAALRYRAPISSALSISGAMHTRRHSDVYTLKRDDPSFYQNTHVTWQSGADAVIQATLTSRVTAAFGGELLDARITSARLGNHRELRRAVFGEAMLALPGDALINAGVRGDWSSTGGGFASPTLGVAVPVGAAMQLRGSVARGYRAPNWMERYYTDPANIADSTLLVESSWSTELGARLTPLRWASVDVAYFDRRATSLIDWARPAGSAPSTPWRTANFARATYQGVEAKVVATRLLGVDWTARASALRLDARAASGVEGKYALRPITRMIGLSAARLVGSRGSLTVDAMSARRIGEREQLQLNARLDRELGRARLTMALFNIANATTLDGSGKPTAGRSVSFGAAWRGR